MGSLVLRNSRYVLQYLMEIRTPADLLVSLGAGSVHTHGNNVGLCAENVVKQLIQTHPIGAEILPQAQAVGPVQKL